MQRLMRYSISNLSKSSRSKEWVAVNPAAQEFDLAERFHIVGLDPAVIPARGREPQPRTSVRGICGKGPRGRRCAPFEVAALEASHQDRLGEWGGETREGNPRNAPFP